MTGRNQTCRNGRVSTYSGVHQGSANRQTSFSGRGNVWIDDESSLLNQTYTKFLCSKNGLFSWDITQPNYNTQHAIITHL